MLSNTPRPLNVRLFFECKVLCGASTSAVTSPSGRVERSTPSGYFGLLSVDRTRQQRGIGRRLVAAAEDFCRSAGCDTIRIRVVNLRTELPPFYESLGYSQAGTEEFESLNVTLPCHFIVMSKRL